MLTVRDLFQVTEHQVNVSFIRGKGLDLMLASVDEMELKSPKCHVRQVGDQYCCKSKTEEVAPAFISGVLRDVRFYDEQVL